MSKFHEEFFKKGSPEHDKLMLKCVSKAGINKIGDALSYTKTIDAYYNSDDEHFSGSSVIICNHAEGQTAHKYDGKEQAYIGFNYSECDPGFLLEEGGNRRRGCIHEKTCDHISTCKWLYDSEPVQEKRIKYIPKIEEVNTSYETEVIVKRGSFIIGYADALISYRISGEMDAQITDGWVWKNYRKLDFRHIVLLEAKPKLTSLGEVIRQLKTYDDTIGYGSQSHQMVIATYTKLDQDAIDYLENENIKVVVFEET